MNLLKQILIGCILITNLNHDVSASNSPDRKQLHWKSLWHTNIQKNQMAVDLQMLLEKIDHPEIKKIKDIIETFTKNQEESKKKWRQEKGDWKKRKEDWKTLSLEEKEAKKAERKEYWHKQDEKEIQLATSIKDILQKIIEEEITDHVIKGQILMIKPLISNFLEKIEAK